MSKPKYRRGKLIHNMAEFERYKGDFFIVWFGNQHKTLHRAFLVSWQYRTLENAIKTGRVNTAEKLKEGE